MLVFGLVGGSGQQKDILEFRHCEYGTLSKMAN